MFRILAAVDNSSYSTVVMQTVSRLAAYAESEVTILTATKPKRFRTTESGGEDESAIKEFHERLIKKYFPQTTLAIETESNLAPKPVSTQGATVHSKIVEGDPADSICNYANTMNADLVIVGKRGQRNVGSTLLGSVSENVVHKCTRSVLVAKGEKLDRATWEDTYSTLHSRPHSLSHQ